MISPGEEKGTSARSVLIAAQEAYDAGISILPVRADGTKKQVLPEWKVYQERLPLPEEIEAWFTNGKAGLAVVGGQVSRNLEILDFDQKKIFARFEEAARAAGLGDSIDRIIRGYLEDTPNGVHLPYRCAAVEGNQKLAKAYRRDPDGNILRATNGKPLTKALIETRGEGGYAIVAPSNGKVHESGRPYVLVSGGFSTIATITPEERELLFELARSFDECRPETPEKPQREKREQRSEGHRPGDELNQRATWEEILEPHGWRRVYEHDGETYWCRPGKERGISATTNFHGSDLFYVFSTSTEFETERGYSKFAVYTLLNHNNDFHKAAAALAQEGYGEARGGHTTEDPQEQKLPEISVTNRPMRKVASDALAALEQKNITDPFLFVRSGAVARIVYDERQRPIIETVNEPALRGYLTRNAEFIRVTAKENKKRVRYNSSTRTCLLQRRSYKISSASRKSLSPLLRVSLSVLSCAQMAAFSINPATIRSHVCTSGRLQDSEWWLSQSRQRRMTHGGRGIFSFKNYSVIFPLPKGQTSLI